MIKQIPNKQSRVDSIMEAITNIVIGSAVALAAQLIWFPLIDKSFSTAENLATMSFFTFISFVRSYFVRRIFNGRSPYQRIKAKVAYKR